MIKDQLHIVHARAGGLDIHKMQISAAVRICQFEAAEPSCETRTFGALPSGVEQLVRWLLEHRVEAAAMEAIGVYWQRPFDALYDAGIEVQLYQSQQIRQLKGRKTDVEDARWLARVCQFGLGRSSYVLCKEFRDLRQMSRCRRNWVGDRSRVRNRVHQVLDRSGLRLGGIITDVFGLNAQHLLRGVLAQQSTAEILRSLSHHVRSKHELFADALDSQLSELTRTVLRALLDQHDALSAQIERTDCHLHQALQSHQEQLDLLRTIPGINHNSAVALFIEIGPNLNAFANVHSSPPGLALPRVTTKARASAAAAASVTATAPSPRLWSNAHMRLLEPKAVNTKSITEHCWCGAATGVQSWPPPTNWRARSMRCFAIKSRIETRCSILKNWWCAATHRAG